MVWFKHSTTSLLDPRIKRLIREYGLEGYGLYFAVLERVALNVTAINRTYELKEEFDIFSEELRIDEEKMKDMFRYMIKAGLLSHNGGSVSAPKMADRLDEYMRKVKAREIKSKDKDIEALVLWHREQVESRLRPFVNEPDMDAWYLGISDVLKGGLSFEEVRDIIERALKDEFWRTKVMTGGQLLKNIDTIRSTLMEGYQTEEEKNKRYEELGL